MEQVFQMQVGGGYITAEDLSAATIEAVVTQSVSTIFEGRGSLYQPEKQQSVKKSPKVGAELVSKQVIEDLYRELDSFVRESVDVLSEGSKMVGFLAISSKVVYVDRLAEQLRKSHQIFSESVSFFGNDPIRNLIEHQIAYALLPCIESFLLTLSDIDYKEGLSRGNLPNVTNIASNMKKICGDLKLQWEENQLRIEVQKSR